MNKYILYTCKKCGNKTKILTQWSDLKPRRCSGKKGKCRTNFAVYPTQLDIQVPQISKMEKKVEKSAPNQASNKVGKNNRRGRKSS